MQSSLQSILQPILNAISATVVNPMFAITLINFSFMIFVIFIQRRNTAATWAWVAAIALVPIGGFIVYMIAGQDSRKQRAFLQKSDEDDILLSRYLDQNLGAKEGDPTYDNRVTLFHDGVIKFESLLEDIKNAKTSIFIQYYILRGDEVGRQLVNALAQKAKEGLEVRLLIDGMGCRANPPEMYDPLLEAGGQLGLFLPPVLVRINFRNHRKISVIDGTVAYLGGSNIGREYLGRSKRFGNWRDTHMRMTGGCVAPLTLRFIMDWNFSAKKSRNRLLLLKTLKQRRFIHRLKETTTEMAVNPAYFKSPKKNLAQPPVDQHTDMLADAHASGADIAIISSGPDTVYPFVLHGFCTMIMKAKKSVYIQSPYFVPDDALFTALRIAGLRGIDVRIMYPANPDHPFVYWAGSSYVGELMCTGVKGYEYEKGFIHSKTIMIDGKMASVGTANMDVRSFKINFETQAFIKDEAITAELEAAFMRDIKDCKQLTLEGYNQRNWRVQVRESISRLFSPLI